MDEKMLLRVYYNLDKDSSQVHQAYQTVQVECTLLTVVCSFVSLLACLFVCFVIVSTPASELIPLVFPDTDVKKARYNIPSDW